MEKVFKGLSKKGSLILLMFFNLSGMEVKKKEYKEQEQKFAVFDKIPEKLEDLKNMTKQLFEPLEKKFGFVFWMWHFKFANPNQWSIQAFYSIQKLPFYEGFKLRDLKWTGEVDESVSDKEFWENKLSQYKIHLMPKTEEIVQYMEKVLGMISKDDNLKKGIVRVKAVVAYPESQYLHSFAPKIVIYVLGKENAQYALNKIYDNFKDDKGSGQVPGFNEHVTDLIFFAQGDRNEKTHYFGLYQTKNRVYFGGEDIEDILKENNIEKKDYRLINPATKK